MSPKEEATAVQLLRRWLAVAAKTSRAVDAVTPSERAALTDEVNADLDRVEADTKAFIAHEDPDA